MKNTTLKLSLLALAMGLSTATNAAIIYTNDFSGGTAANFTGANAVTTAPNGESYLGHLNGGATANLDLTGLAAHSSLTLEFDVIGLRSLDGTTSGDNFQLFFDGSSIFQDFFGHSGGFLVGPTTGTLVSHDQTALGYGHFYGGASTYTYSLEFAHSDSDVSFGFRGNTDQGWNDEAFAIDNVKVSINSTDVPEPSALALFSMGLYGIFRRKSKKC